MARATRDEETCYERREDDVAQRRDRSRAEPDSDRDRRAAKNGVTGVARQHGGRESAGAGLYGEHVRTLGGTDRSWPAGRDELMYTDESISKRDRFALVESTSRARLLTFSFSPKARAWRSVRRG